jgi:hypothetical protein
MGTFHRDAHPLHGITCVVRTRRPATWIGRVDAEEPAGLVLLDADVCEGPVDGPEATRFLDRSSKFGHWPRMKRVVVPKSEILSVVRLAEVTPT